MNTISSEFKNHRLYPHFKLVQARLNTHGFVCWLAGGAVRDLLLGREVGDFDLVTDATYENILRLFPEAIKVGEAFAVAKIPLESNVMFDLASFREEAEYADGRRPTHVVSSIPNLDAGRRDFTVNALYWDDLNEVVRDYESGVVDLQKKILRCVGDGNVRFQEDFLRVLRLMRFSAQLNFAIEEKTEQAALKFVPHITRISGERLWSEFKKIDVSRSWTYLKSSQLCFEIFRTLFELNQQQTQSLLSGLCADDLMMSLAVTLGELDLSSILRSRFKISNADLKYYSQVRKVSHQMGALSIEEALLEMENSQDLVSVLDKTLANYPSVVTYARNLLATFEKCPSPLVNRRDLLNLVPDKAIGEEYRYIRLRQLSSSFKTKDEVLEYLGKKYASGSVKP